MADDLNQPFIGYRSAGRRRAELNDRAASADAPLALLRGIASGVLGAPGDIESLVRMLPGLSEQTVLPTSRDVEARLPLRGVSQTPVGRAATELGTLGGGFYTGPGSPLRALASLPAAVSHGAGEFARAAGGAGAHVVKPKGGNWLAGSVERAIEPLKVRVVGSDPAARLRDLDAAYAQNVEAGVAMDPAVFARERARLEPEAAMNRWLETKLAKYIRNEMATPEDPIRALAEAWPARKQELLAAKRAQIDKAVADMEAARAQRLGFTPEMMTRSQARIRELEKERDLIAAREGLHFDPAMSGYGLKKPREAGGFPAEGMGVSDLARRWESRADSELSNILQASDITKGYPGKIDENPWLLKVPPETRVYDILRGSDRDLGFDHMVDELKNAINPESGLPAELLWKYGDLEKKTVPDVVNRVADINAWRAMQKAEADRARAMNAATHLVKEYPEQGLRWVELKLPEKTGKNVARTKSAEELEMAGEGVETMSHDDIVAMTRDMARDEGIRPGTQEFNNMLQENIRMFGEKPSMVDESEAILADALKYEGELLQHCVGGYCPDVLEGRSRIFSLRDESGRPHVTIETQPAEHLDYNKWFRSQTEDMQNEIARRRMADKNYNVYETPEYLAAFADLPPNIKQIKGLLNRAPNAEYLPAVQDFVRSQKWGKVGDLQNTGLIQIHPEGGYGLRGSAEHGGVAPGFYTQQELDAAMKDALGTGLTPGAHGEGFALGGLVQKYADGGLVGSNIYNSDAMQDPASAYRFADGGQAGDVRAYADGGLVANSPTADFDPARIDAIVGDLNALNAG